ncbi:neural Wiskott-Aldrich syndrome protein-like isoform X2 [Penaeus japonicus]|uniref:neural Wiskott-Aldrich syndrome protein-like isoform X2 n=1 Tax=Penaeus japonicus TaxID=27405 RepID=UPI001C710B21|nr:neural Wiskott-Aldrich syndrome protein-like isoform X2 [Penaeus japonicus]
MATNIDALVKETEETDFALNTQDELLSLIRTLKDFEQEAERKLKDMRTTQKESKEAKDKERDEEEDSDPSLNGGDTTAEVALAEVRRELMSLESGGHEGGTRQDRRERIAAVKPNRQNKENVSPEYRGKSSIISHPHIHSPPKVKFDIDALNHELANLLALSGKAVESQQAWRGIARDTPKEVPATPPSTPSHTARPLPGQTQGPVPPSSQTMGPPKPPRSNQGAPKPTRSNQGPPKPPRTFLAPADNLKIQPAQLSKSTGDLVQPERSSSQTTSKEEAHTSSPVTGEDEDSDHRAKNSGKKDNVFFSSSVGKKVRERITTIRRKGSRRSKSLVISNPMDFRILYNGILPNHRDSDREQLIIDKKGDDIS